MKVPDKLMVVEFQYFIYSGTITGTIMDRLVDTLDNVDGGCVYQR